MMKTTSYIIVGLVGLGAVCSFGGGIAAGLNATYSHESRVIEVEGTEESRPTRHFSVLSADVYRFCDSIMVDFDSDVVINVVEDKSVDVPTVAMNSDWDKYLTLRESGDSLKLEFDFHALLPGKSFTKPSAKNNVRLFVHTFKPQPIYITVPPSMLGEVDPGRFTQFRFNGIETDSMKFGMLTGMQFESCRLGRASFSGNALNCTISLADTKVDSMLFDVPAVSCRLDAHNSEVNMLRWTDTSERDGKTARLAAGAGVIGGFEWSSPVYGNKAECSIEIGSEGHQELADIK